MHKLKLSGERRLNVLCLGAHCDDIEIGCGGTILRLSNEDAIGGLRWVVFSSNQVREAEARESARYFTRYVADTDIDIMQFRDTVLSQDLIDIKSHFEKLKLAFAPDVIFTHYRDDHHQDHALISSLTWNTFRDHLILEYEVPKYDGDLGHPGLYVKLPRDIAQQKVDALMQYFPSQSDRHWFDRESFYSMMRLRGLECASQYAEAFHLRKGLI